jgi:small-conductance mechanosensitive channel
MRVFTDDEKQKLQAKIKDEQERQRVLKEIAQIENEKEAKRKKGIISTALSYKYGFLVLIICLLVWDVTSLLERRNSGYDQYGSLIIVLTLLFNHIAYQFTKKGWLSRVMKTIAWIWIAFVWAYLFKTGVV